MRQESPQSPFLFNWWSLTGQYGQKEGLIGLQSRKKLKKKTKKLALPHAKALFLVKRFLNPNSQNSQQLIKILHCNRTEHIPKT